MRTAVKLSPASGANGAVAVRVLVIGLLALSLVAPFFLYPVFVMRALCMALFACAFNLLVGYVGLLSFGHAAFFGSAAYITAHTARSGACRRSSAFRPVWRSRSPSARHSGI